MSNKILKYLTLLALILLIVAISSFWFSGSSFRERDVVFELEGPTQISAGADTIYTLKYENNTRSTLYDLDFHFVYPEGSVAIIDGAIIEDYSENFSVEELGPGEEGEKEFHAFVMGEKGSIKVAKATLSFRAGGLNSNFEKTSNLSTTIIDAPISLVLVAPPSLISGAAIQYILDYRNLSGEDASDLVVEFDYPDGFSPRNYDPTPLSGKNIWAIDLIKKGAGGRITIDGVINGKEDESKIVTARLKRKIGGDYVDYQKASAMTVISNPVLGLEMLVNNSNDFLASLGDRLSYSINYSNNSNINMSGMNLSVKLDGDMYDFSTLDTRGGYFDSSNRSIVWDSSTIPDFTNFTPGTSGKINFTVNLKSSFSSVVPGSSQERFVKATARFGTFNVPSGFSGTELNVSSGLVTKITTQPSFNHSAYFNDPNLGSFGPFPLRVGEETAFTIHWQLSNPGNDIDNVSVSAKLPSGVSWENLSGANNNLPAPSFNPNTSEVVWNFPRLSYGAGIFTEKYEGYFRIKVKPVASQRGTSVTLIDGAVFSGTDNFTKQTISVSRGAISSDNIADRPRQGTVQ